MSTLPVTIERRGPMLAANIPTRTGSCTLLAVPWAPNAEQPLRATAAAILRHTGCCHTEPVAHLGPIQVSRRVDAARWRLPRLVASRRGIALGWRNTSYVAAW